MISLSSCALAPNRKHNVIVRGYARTSARSVRCRASRSTDVTAAVGAAALQAESVGPACRTLLGLPDSKLSSLESAIRYPDDLQKVQTALAVLQKQGLHGAQLAGAAAAGTWVPETPAVIAVQLPSYTTSNHSAHLQQIAKQVKDVTGFTDVEVVQPLLTCSYEGIRLVIVVCGSEPVDVLQLLNPSLSAEQRAVLSCNTIVASTVFMQQQPDLYKTAALVVKRWASKTNATLSDSEPLPWAEEAFSRCVPDNRSVGYFLDLVVLLAYQSYIASCAKDAVTNGPNSIGYGEAAALDAVLYGFLRLMDVLDDKTVYAWNWLYQHDLANEVAGSTELADVLRPRPVDQPHWSSACPFVLDPADPSNNVANTIDDEQLIELIVEACCALNMCLRAEVHAVATAQAESAALLVAQRKQPQTASQLAEQHQEATRLQTGILAAASGEWSLLAEPAGLTASSWLPCANGHGRFMAVERVGAEAPGFGVCALARPFAAAASGYNPGMAIELRLDPNSNPFVRVLEALQVPFAVTLKKGSTLTFTRTAGSLQGLGNGAIVEFATDKEIVLEQDIKGLLGSEAGLVWELSRLQWYQLGLCEVGVGVTHDLNVLKAQAEAGCTLHGSLPLVFGEGA